MKLEKESEPYVNRFLRIGAIRLLNYGQNDIIHVFHIEKSKSIFQKKGTRPFNAR